MDTKPAWMASGYGGSLLTAEGDRVLVSFVEFSKNPRQQLDLPDQPAYIPKIVEPGSPELRAALNHLLP